MEWAIQSAQLVLAVAMFYVWLFRYRSPGFFRGGDATTMEEEFRVYGLPDWFRNLVRALKLSAGLLMVVGIWDGRVALAAGLLLTGLMAGAVAMHLKVKDPLIKALPSTAFLLLSAWIAWAHRFAF